jgi:hypothetical protein
MSSMFIYEENIALFNFFTVYVGFVLGNWKTIFSHFSYYFCFETSFPNMFLIFILSVVDVIIFTKFCLVRREQCYYTVLH